MGTVRIQPGGKVTVGQDTVVAGGDLLSLEGGTFTTSQISFERFGSAGANFQWTSGTLHVGLFQGNLVNSAGVLSPGSSIGATQIQGNYNQLTDGALEIEIGPMGPGAQNDSVSVTGTAIIDGQLSLNLINSAAPLPSQTFIILDAITLAGSFDNVASGQRLTTSDALGSFLVHYGVGSPFDSRQIVLSSFQTSVSGDFDVDGDVDGNDFLVWQRGGSPNPNSAADLAQWRTNFGAGGVASAISAVPEPNAEWLVLTIICLACAFRARFCGERTATVRTRP
jgi:hypothetical protein